MFPLNVDVVGSGENTNQGTLVRHPHPSSRFLVPVIPYQMVNHDRTHIIITKIHHRIILSISFRSFINFAKATAPHSIFRSNSKKQKRNHFSTHRKLPVPICTSITYFQKPRKPQQCSSKHPQLIPLISRGGSARASSFNLPERALRPPTFDELSRLAPESGAGR